MGRDWNRADLKGRQFGKLTVWLLTDRRIGGHAIWQCRCECGGWTDATSANLKSGNTLSCGCEQIARTMRATSDARGKIVERNSEAILAAKLASKKSFAAIAKETAIANHRIYRIIKGRTRYAPIRDMRRIAAALGVPVESIILGIVGGKSPSRK